MSIKPSRTTLVAFFNDILQLRISKVDDLGNGAAYCQLLDSIYGDVPMHRVKFDTRVPLEMEQNYKVLQQAFIAHKIAHNFDVPRLMKCRLQDNLDFSQWLYQFWHESPHIEGYDPISRRSSSSYTKLRKVSPSVQSPTPASNPLNSTANGPLNGSMNGSMNGSSRPRPVQAPDLLASRTPARQMASFYTPNNGNAVPNNAPALVSQQRIAALEEEIDELGKTVDVLMEERGLYYEKLLDIEQLMNQHIDKFYASKGESAAMENATDPKMVLIRQIQEILFSSPEGFQPQTRPEDEPF